MTIIHEEARNERARNLEAKGLNGLRLALVTLYPDDAPAAARLEVHFHNGHELAHILADLAGGTHPKDIFPISGGHRVRGGAAAGQVKVTAVGAEAGPDHSLELTVEPIGDYSTYTLAVQFPNMDPVFGEIDFKFRPGCFSTECAPRRSSPGPHSSPAIDYLAKDYDSFRHALIVAMRGRVPGWEPTSEADFSTTLIDLFSAAGDELSDFQDRVVNEAYLGSARNRVSLARHARLMDYHVHQGNQAGTWLAILLEDGQEIALRHDDPEPYWLKAWTGGSVTFLAARPRTEREEQTLHHWLNNVKLHTWSGAQPGLAEGAVEADLQMPDEGAASTVCDLIRKGAVRYLLIQEHRNPGTGGEAGWDPNKRQVLELVVDDRAPDDDVPRVGQDPLTDEWFAHVRWRDADKLEHDYCFTSGNQQDVSLFHGNLVRVYQGQQVSVIFKQTGPSGAHERLYRRTPEEEQQKGSWKPGRSASVVCELPAGEPLLYRKTPVAPRGQHEPNSTLDLQVHLADGTIEHDWTEVISLVHSRDEHWHFAVETDELGRSLLRFGNGSHGRELPSGAEVHCTYQTGFGPDGNVGADRIVHFDHPLVDRCWNPFDVTDGRAPEPREEIIRNVPEAYRARQLRAVTLEDYVRRAEELPGVARAAARYAWTGSWRTVRITIDPAGSETLTDELRGQVAAHLDAVRLIGEDLEIRPPRFVPLTIEVRICVHPDFWLSDVRFDLEEAFSDGYTSAGETGFFHPDRWTFGQTLRASQIIGRAQRVPGVERVIEVKVSRWDSPTPGTAEAELATVGPSEIIQVRNDPDHMELGSITFELDGGRQ